MSEEVRSVWVESPDGMRVEEHTPANARDLITHQGWRKIKAADAEGPKEEQRMPRKEAHEDVQKEDDRGMPKMFVDEKKNTTAYKKKKNMKK